MMKSLPKKALKFNRKTNDDGAIVFNMHQRTDKMGYSGLTINYSPTSAQSNSEGYHL